MRKSTIEPVGAITDRPRDLKQIAIANSDLFIISCGNSTICKQIVDGRSMSAPTGSNERFWKTCDLLPLQGSLFRKFKPASVMDAGETVKKGAF